MPNLIAKLDTHQGFATSFKDAALTEKLQQDENSDGLNVSQSLFPALAKDHPDYGEYIAVKPAIQAVLEPRSIRTRAGSLHRQLTLPTDTDGEGILVASKFACYDGEMTRLKAQLDAAKPLAIEALPQALAYARKRKNGCWREDKCPQPSDIDNITFGWSYKDPGQSGSQQLLDMIKQLGDERAAQVCAEADERAKKQVEEAVQTAMLRTVKAVSELAEMLANPDHKLMPGRLEKAAEQVALGKDQMRDLLGNAQVDAQFDQLKTYLENVDLDAFKKSNSLRLSSARELARTAMNLGEMGQRKFS